MPGLCLERLNDSGWAAGGDAFSAAVTHLNEIAFERASDGGVTGFRVSNGRTRGVWFERR